MISKSLEARSLRWVRARPLVKWLGPRQWVIPAVLSFVYRSVYGGFLALIGLAGCAQKKAFIQNPQIQFPSHRIAVLPFESGNPYVSGSALSDCFIVRILQDIPSLQVIERRDLMKILQEQKLTLTGIVRQDKFTNLGMILGVDAVLVGSVQTLEVIQSAAGSILVNVKLIEVSTGRILWADRQKITHSTWSAKEVEEVSAILLEKAAKRMVEKMEKSLIAGRCSLPESDDAMAFIKEAKLTAKDLP